MDARLPGGDDANEGWLEAEARRVGFSFKTKLL